MSTLQAVVIGGERFIGPRKERKNLHIVEFLKKLGIPAAMLGVFLVAVLFVGSITVGLAGHYGRIMSNGSINGQIDFAQTQITAPINGGNTR